MIQRRTVLLLGAAAGLGIRRGAFAAAPDTVRVTKPGERAFIFTFAEIGTAKGFYLANGLSVESVGVGGGGPGHQALATASIEFVFGAGSEMQLAAKGAPELAVASIMKAPAQIALGALANSPIRTPDDALYTERFLPQA
jgi:ABC-type nitrate/sulfonate/bicarbonate transport system substrate-binding protein